MYMTYKNKWLISELVDTITEFCAQEEMTKAEAHQMIASLTGNAPEFMARALDEHRAYREQRGDDD